jgi:hypothetical protein
MSDLPAGVHPKDRAEPVGPGFGSNNPVPADQPIGAYKLGTAPFSTDNDEALATFTRASSDWSARIVVVDANAAGTAIVAGRRKGRTAVVLSVPTTLGTGATPLGVIVGPTEDDVLSYLGYVLNVGDSLTLETEGPVYAGLISGKTTGAVQAVEFFNPPGSTGL